MNRSEFKKKTCDAFQVQRKARVRQAVPFGFDFPSDRLKKKNGRFDVAGYSARHMRRFLTKKRDGAHQDHPAFFLTVKS